MRIFGELKKKGAIDPKTREALVPSHPQPGRFSMLPKMHRPVNLDRPITPAIGTLTELISSNVDLIIGRLPYTFSSFIKDTNHFLREVLILEIQEDVSLEVSSLYTNIPHKESLAALMETYKGLRKENVRDGCALGALIRLVRELNSFEFH